MTLDRTMYTGLVNSPETTITNGIGVNDTLIYVLDPTRVPEDLPNLMVLGTGTNAETVQVTDNDEGALTVVRGFQGVAKEWLAGTQIARYFTEYDYESLRQNVEQLDTETDDHYLDTPSLGDGVHGIISIETKTYYLDETDGNDSNNGLTEETAFKTWEKVDSLIPLILNHNYNIKIIGNYTGTITLSARNVTSGTLVIEGNSTTPSDQIISGNFYIFGCQGSQTTSVTGIVIRYLRFTGACSIASSSGIRYVSCEPRRSGDKGISILASSVILYSLDFGTDVVQDCIYASYNSLVFSDSNTGNGTRYGLYAYMGARIQKAATGSQPTGTTLNDYESSGEIVTTTLKSHLADTTKHNNDGQLTFPATQNPSSDPNTLDDYEEGNWTPDLQFNNAKVGITYFTQTGNYTKIGNRVYFSALIILTSKGSSTGISYIYGLPFTPIETTACNYRADLMAGSCIGHMQALIQSGTGRVGLEMFSGGTMERLTDTAFTNSSVIVLSGHYKI